MSKKPAPAADYLSTNALKIILTGPFKTDTFLNSKETAADEYIEQQKAVKILMKEILTQYDFEIPKSGQGQQYESGAQGTGKAYNLPYYIKCIAKDSGKTILSIDKYKFMMGKIEIKFYEFGFATVSVPIEIVSTCPKNKKKNKIQIDNLLNYIRDLDTKIVRGEIEEINTEMQLISKKFIDTVKEIKVPQFFNENTKLETRESVFDDVKSLHRIFLYEVENDSKVKGVKNIFGEIAQLSGGVWNENNSFSHFVGVANSVMIYNCSSIRNESKIRSRIIKRYLDAYKTVLGDANAYYFIAKGLTKDLSEYSRSELLLMKEEKKSWLKKIFFSKKRSNQNQFASKFDERKFLVANFFSMLDEYNNNLNYQGKSVWNSMEKVWTTSEAARMLENQLSDSSSMFDRIINYKTQKFQVGSNWIAAILVIIGAITLVETSQPGGFNWKFDFAIWNFDSFGDLISKVINLFGSLLAIGLIGFVALLILYGVWIVVMNKLFNRDSHR